MGADMLIQALVIDAKRKPDWAAARAAIEAMTVEELTPDYDELLDPTEKEAREEVEARAELADNRQQELVDAVAYVEQALSGDNRLVAQIQIRGADVYVIGGESWGDAPEGTEEFAAFMDSPAYEAAGFEHQIFVPASTKEDE